MTDILDSDGRSASAVVGNRVSELSRLNALLEGFWAAQGLPQDLSDDFALALEEVFLNVVTHGYQDDAEHGIRIRLAIHDGDVELTVDDDGVAFNPLDLPAPDTTLSAVERQVGGLGVHLIRQLMDDVSYTRVGGRNRLSMKKKIPRST